MKPETLPEHPAFSRLQDSEKQKLLQSSELWEASAGAHLFYAGDSGEELILLLEGRLESQSSDGTIGCWLPGDLWGEDRLADPVPLESALTASEDSRWLSWSREALFSLLLSSAHMRKALIPFRDSDDRLLSGFPDKLPVSSGKKGKIRPSLRPALAAFIAALPAAVVLYLLSLRIEQLPFLLFLLVPAAYTGWLLVFLLKRLTRVYGIDSESITSKTFDWGHFTVESRYVPFDRVQGVETEKNGILRHILHIGTIIVKTSALDGEIIFQDVQSPESLRAEILNLQKKGSRRNNGRERESIRKTLEESGLGSRTPVKIKSADPIAGGRKKASDEIIFRKSPAVLLGRLTLPFLTLLIPVLGSGMLSGLLNISSSAIFLTALIPFLWLLYRFEDWRNDIFRISGGYVIDLYRKPLGLKESRRQVELASVQNIKTEQKGLLPFLFRYGDVILVTAGGAADTVFLKVARPWKVQETLFLHRENDLRRREKASRDQRKEDFVKFAEALDQIRESSPGSSLSPGSSNADSSKR